MSKDQLRPLVKKDVFYTGSVQNLREYQSQGSLAAYRQSNLSIPQQKHRGKKSNVEESRKKSPLHTITTFVFVFPSVVI